ncbi:unnamed protein product [Microthlaspi erraticum]|uniref:Uncharacterized protein n=1 Tax=Microthlaspi erraticum TaxID=1685480 RepID=A0A6D2IUJ7_9BRAS|nr:unnamed protein product [Microthlaspi erraticum]
MNPSVVAAHKRIGLLQKFNKWQGKAMDAKVHGQDGEQDQEFGEEGFWFFKQEEEGTHGPTFPRSRSLLTTPRRLCPRASQSLFFRAKGRRDNTQRRRKTSKARRSSSTTGLDRVQTEETQLDRADLEEPLFENPGFEYDPTPTRTSPRPLDPYNSFEQAQLHQGQGSHTL